MALGETITVVNKSGKVVSTSKHLVNVFNEAKSAYLERKAELKAKREDTVVDKKRVKGGKSSSRPETPTRRPTHSRSSSRGSHYEHQRSGSRSPRYKKPTVDHGYADSYYENDRIEQVRRTRTMPPSPSSPTTDLVRRHSDSDRANLQQIRRPSQSSLHDPNIDMDLAYGELPPSMPLSRMDTETELKTKMSGLNRMLEEANCLKFSAAAIIKSLENNPDAMAAVALSLAEISNLVAKVGPGVLTSMKGTFPAVIALLASPEFAIAIGVGVGLTVVALGGYKIVKRIKAKTTDKSQVDELEEVNADISHVEAWRRGVDFPDDVSVVTSVEGEFVTPGASKQLEEQGLLEPKEKAHKKDKKDKKDKDKKKKHHKSSKSDAGSTRSSKASDDGKTSKKEPSGLRMLFKKDK